MVFHLSRYLRKVKRGFANVGESSKGIQKYEDLKTFLQLVRNLTNTNSFCLTSGKRYTFFHKFQKTGKNANVNDKERKTGKNLT
jgi:hypothetical protein